MLTFWIMAMGLAVAVAAAILVAMMRQHGAAGERPELSVYRDQMSEVDRDLARGVLDADEAERARAEVGRRLLAADREGGHAAAAAPRGLTWAVMALVGLGVVAGATATYIEIGVPGYPDQPLVKRIERSEDLRRNRPSQADAEAAVAANLPDLPQADPEFLELMRRLRGAVAERPNDIQGLRLLARNEAGIGNFSAATEAQLRLIDLLDQPEAVDYANLAEYYVAATAGYVSPEAEQAIAKALEIDPRDRRARYFAGFFYYQIGRADLAFDFWAPLLREGPEDAPWIPQIRAQIATLARLAGELNYVPPEPAGRGPSADDMAAAAEMAPEDRQAMIRGMVDGLAERLASDGGPSDDWARLIRALGVLGDTDRAAAIWAEAQQVFAASPADLAAVRAAAETAGIAGE